MLDGDAKTDKKNRKTMKKSPLKSTTIYLKIGWLLPILVLLCSPFLSHSCSDDDKLSLNFHDSYLGGLDTETILGYPGLRMIPDGIGGMDWEVPCEMHVMMSSRCGVNLHYPKSCLPVVHWDPSQDETLVPNSLRYVTSSEGGDNIESVHGIQAEVLFLRTSWQNPAHQRIVIEGRERWDCAQSDAGFWAQGLLPGCWPPVAYASVLLSVLTETTHINHRESTFWSTNIGGSVFTDSWTRDLYRSL